MIEDESSDTNYTSATNDENDYHNSIATNNYTTPNIDIDVNNDIYSDNDNISSVCSDNSNNNNIGFVEENDIVNEHPLMNSSNSKKLYDLNIKTFLMENNFQQIKCVREVKS